MTSAYARYLVFFHSEIGRLGPLGAVKEYVFSPEAVSEPSASARQEVPVLMLRTGTVGTVILLHRC